MSLPYQAMGEGDLVRFQLRRPAEAHAPLHGDDSAGAGSLVDQRALELSNTGEYRQHHAHGWGRGVSPRFAQAAQPGTGVLELFGDFEEIAGGSSQAIEAGHHDDIVFPNLVEHTGQLRPITLGIRDLLLVTRLQPASLSAAR